MRNLRKEASQLGLDPTRIIFTNLLGLHFFLPSSPLPCGWLCVRVAGMIWCRDDIDVCEAGITISGITISCITYIEIMCRRVIN